MITAIRLTALLASTARILSPVIPLLKKYVPDVTGRKKAASLKAELEGLRRDLDDERERGIKAREDVFRLHRALRLQAYLCFISVGVALLALGFAILGK